MVMGKFLKSGIAVFAAALLCVSLVLAVTGCETETIKRPSSESGETPLLTDFIFSGERIQVYDGTPKSFSISARPGKTTGTITVFYQGTGGTNYPKSATAPSAIGTYAITFNVAASEGYKSVSGLNAGSFTIKAEDPVDTEELSAKNKYEFRAVWVSTVGNLDIQRQGTETAFRNAYNRILDKCDEFNMNAIVFQVSPMLDAYYPSELNPWSQFASGGQQGTPLSYDPLAIMLEETHKRGMEFHAWFNPYRVTYARYNTINAGGTAYTQEQVDAMTTPQVIALMNQAGTLHNSNFAVKNPSYVYKFDRLFYLDPGYPEVREHIAAVAKEVIEHYDVDAIHYDDYFYPYSWGTAAAHKNSVRASWDMYAVPDGYTDTQAEWERWFRDNNDKFVQGVKAVIDAENTARNKAIQFGISPIGVWARGDVPGGFNIGSTTSFTYKGGVYADTKKWVEEETVDYMVPQIYWAIENTGSPYKGLADWWAGIHQNKNVHLYIGHANYKHVDGTLENGFNDAQQILNQIKYHWDGHTTNIKGSIFFSYKTINAASSSTQRDQTLLASNQAIKDYWNNKAIVPPKPWLDSAAPAAPTNVSRNGRTLTWTDTAANNSRYYVIYRVTTATANSNNPTLVLQDASKIVGKVWRSGETSSWTDSTQSPSQYTYYVTAFNAAHVESAPAAVQ